MKTIIFGLMTCVSMVFPALEAVSRAQGKDPLSYSIVGTWKSGLVKFIKGEVVMAKQAELIFGADGAYKVRMISGRLENRKLVDTTTSPTITGTYTYHSKGAAGTLTIRLGKERPNSGTVLWIDANRIFVTIGKDAMPFQRTRP